MYPTVYNTRFNMTRSINLRLLDPSWMPQMQVLLSKLPFYCCIAEEKWAVLFFPWLWFFHLLQSLRDASIMGRPQNYSLTISLPTNFFPLPKIIYLPVVHKDLIGQSIQMRFTFLKQTTNVALAWMEIEKATSIFVRPWSYLPTGFMYNFFASILSIKEYLLLPTTQQLFRLVIWILFRNRWD